jgi:hypothetical protein
LSRNAVTRSINPSAFATRPISNPPLSIQLCSVVSSQRPSTLTQQATLNLIRETAQQLLESVSTKNSAIEILKPAGLVADTGQKE